MRTLEEAPESETDSGSASLSGNSEKGKGGGEEVEPLTEAERDIYEVGLVGIRNDIHDQIDAAAFEAYGWPADLCGEEILERLVALNHERAEEEARRVPALPPVGRDEPPPTPPEAGPTSRRRRSRVRRRFRSG